MTNFSITATYTDLYQISMAQVYFLTGKAKHEAVFDYFFRKHPFAGGYTIFAGLENVLDILHDLHFNKQDLDYLRSLGLQKEFVDYLETFRFRGTVFAAREGEVVFPNEPLITVSGNILEAQLIETILLNFVNFQSLIATKAARIRSVAGNRTLSDFGLRRAQGIGGYHATRAAVIGGFNATSNVMAARDFSIPAVGTMAHSFIQSYDDELQAFRDFATQKPDHCVLLVDTYDTHKSGIPNAIIAAKEMEQRQQRLSGIRLDSGDLAYLSKHARSMLDAAGLQYVKITASNQLDEYVIKSLLDQQAPIDVFGVGTSLVTGPPDAALDGVYKLAYANGKPRIKLSENIKKVTLPGKKQVFRLVDTNGNSFEADVITRENESNVAMMYHTFEPDKSLDLNRLDREPLLHKVMENGRLMGSHPPLNEIAAYTQTRLSLLPKEHKRFEYPHIYKVGISKALQEEQNQLKSQYKK